MVFFQFMKCVHPHRHREPTFALFSRSWNFHRAINCPQRKDMTPYSAMSTKPTVDSSKQEPTPPSLVFSLPIPPSSIATIVQPDYWPPKNSAIPYDWSCPSHEFYKWSSNEASSYSPTFSQARCKLDYSYHTHVVLHRQYLQDSILKRIVQPQMRTTDSFFDHTTNVPNSAVAEGSAFKEQPPSPDSIVENPQVHRRPWIIFTAGPMGVGKGFVLTQLQQRNLMNLDDFVKIDPDLIKFELPEMVGYLQEDRTTASTKLHRESTQMADIIFEYAINNSMPILVDGSLRDVAYYQTLFNRIRNEFPLYRIGIIHITASREVIFDRATTRAKFLGRVVPKVLLEASIEQVPKSVAILSPLADAVHVISNQPDQPMELISSTFQQFNSTDSESKACSEVISTWDDFAQSWNRDTVAMDVAGDDRITIKDSTARARTNRDASAKNDDPCRKPSNEKFSNKLHCTTLMSLSFADTDSHGVANQIWQNSYPNFCARCAITTDTQCGRCIHSTHICACMICRPNIPCSNDRNST